MQMEAVNECVYRSVMIQDTMTQRDLRGDQMLVEEVKVVQTPEAWFEFEFAVCAN
jgi:hypothetical protein